MLKPSSLSHLCLRRSFLRLSSTLASNVEVKGKGNEKGEGRRKSRYAPSSAAVLNGRIMEGETFQATITFALASSPSMNYVNWATTFSTLGKFKNKKTNTDEFKKLIKEFEGKLDGGLKWIPIREVASVAQSFRYLGVDSYKFREFINSNAEEITTSGNPRSLADITLIYKEAGGEYFEEMERKEVVKLMCEGRVSNVAKYVAGVAKIGSKVPVLARVMDEEKVVEKFVRAHPQDLSTTVFGMARLGHEVPKFLEALGQKDVVDRIAGAYPEDISNTIWSFAAYGYKSPHLIEAITQREEVTQKIIGGREVDISRTIFALQKLEVEVPASLKEALRLKKAKRKNTKLMKEGAVDLPFKRGVSPVVIEQNLKLRELQKSKDWSGMLRYAAKRFEGFDHVNWTTLFSELGKFRFEGKKIAEDENFKKLLGEFEGVLEKEGLRWMDVRGIANVMHGLGLLRVESAVALAFVEDNCGTIVEEASAKEIADIANCYACLKFEGTELWGAIRAEKVVEKIMAGKVRNQTFVIWSAATLGHKVSLLAEALEEEAAIENMLGGEKHRVPVNLTNQLWALEAMGRGESMGRMVEAALKEVKEGRFREGDDNRKGVATNVKRRLAHCLERLGADIFDELGLIKRDVVGR